MSHNVIPTPDPNCRMHLEASILRSEGTISLDCGVDDTFIDRSLVDRTGIPVELLPDPKDVNALDGLRLALSHHSTPRPTPVR